MTVRLHIEGAWREALAAAGLDTFDALMATTAGERHSGHARGQTYRIVLDDRRAVWVKRNFTTSIKDLWEDLWHFRRPVSAALAEVWALREMAAMGIPAPEPIAWAQCRRAALPAAGVVVMTELPGTPLDKFLATDPPPEQRLAALHGAGQVAARIYEAGLSWPDLRAKHIIVSEPTPGVLDLTRMRPARRLTRGYVLKELRRFCGELRDQGCDDADVSEMLGAVRAGVSGSLRRRAAKLS